MPAHVPRRSFAKPFIVTFAAASALACEPKSVVVEPPTHNPPAQDDPVPEASAPTASTDRWWKLERGADGTCTIQLSTEKTSTAYACPADVQVYPSTIMEHRAEAKCAAVWEPEPMHCPPGSFCNPPPTQAVDVPCPK